MDEKKTGPKAMVEQKLASRFELFICSLLRVFIMIFQVFLNDVLTRCIASGATEGVNFALNVCVRKNAKNFAQYKAMNFRMCERKKSLRNKFYIVKFAYIYMSFCQIRFLN